ncbi:FkbM family methyltransferase [Magnetospira sp. QH-2]|uniref:FkbM family methyltransferase n=1 Tax=Magnetospira sp. (strain QH-2) TaxID=1288970 RepID=UPI0003E80EE1|nr:FkbM family methyltransferase [Magnetospira sp. QH-2]CCQ75500.1 protein of unknown function [Magnetospira sp. QH-2]
MDGIRFSGSGAIPLRRAVTLLDTEPDIIHWLEEQVDENDVLFDIGANIGLYTLYAAIKKQAEVVALEPMSLNFNELNKNIMLNGLDDHVVALNVAMHDELVFDRLNISGFVEGKAGHGFGQAAAGTGRVAFKPAYRQGVIGISVDDLVHKLALPFPNHIKIDVDGNESKIVRGMGEVLKDARLKSIAVELEPEDFDDDRAAIELIISHGFKELTAPSYRNPELAKWTNVRNHFFVRK